MLVERPREKRHHLGREKKGIGLALLAEGRLVAAAPAGAAKGSPAMCRKDRDVVWKAAQPDLECAQRFQREVNREVRPEEVGAGDCAEHHCAAREQSSLPSPFADQVGLVVGRVSGRVDRSDRDLADLQLGADVES